MDTVTLEIPFFKKLTLPTLSFQLFKGREGRLAGIDIGTHSAKVVQLRYEGERAILETYGELLSGGYLKGGSGTQGGLLRYSDEELAAELRDLLRESNITAREAVLSVPAQASFITAIPFAKKIPLEEIAEAIPFEARKYVPIPISEVVFDWEIIDTEEKKEEVIVILVVVPREIIEKYKRVASAAGFKLRAVEVETFSLIRSLTGRDPTPSAVINLGHNSSSMSLVDKGKLRLSHTTGHGTQELVRALSRGIGVSEERAEIIMKEVGLSERLEEQETVSIIIPLMETAYAELERIMAIYNRRAERKIQRIILTGGGAQLKGLVDYVSTKFGLEVLRGNPFAKVVMPAFMQPIVREISPSFAVAVGLALHGISHQ